MKRVKLFPVVLSLLLIISVSGLNAQDSRLGVVGKLFEREEANKLFGKVIRSITIDAETFKNAIKKGNNYIFIASKDKHFVIRDEKENYLLNDKLNLNKSETFYLFSKSVLQELLNSKGKTNRLFLQNNAKGEDTVTLELRESVITLSYGDATLEMGLPCPPFCNA